ncbi:hypothetical protein P7K49_037213 [Saguinus oedipus]|uniref:Olduvai domain-containing protein n=1 Tax=Saguinus oedipus TaxID=9490 RepID=A0ABQ9THW3_SAGOE|nr:hypothetical protein P7K49_037213 [Saguinus oedipus]
MKHMLRCIGNEMGLWHCHKGTQILRVTDGGVVGTSVPGSAFGATNVTMVAPGRICSRQTTEVNFPDIVENSYTQQEETKLSFRDSKNRLLLSQVAYFQNYQLKTDKDQKDHDEEQKYRDSKNKHLMSQVAYYLACRLKLKFCGFLCSAPASGRPPLRKISAVNIPEGIEKSCSQQEEKKPNVRASKNRLLSQVAYFQNYRMKTYKDQKDQEEEQNYRDSKNKLFMSQVAYYLACRLKMKVPGLLCSAPNVIMVASGKPFSKKIPEVNVPEGTEKSCSQQEDKKLDFGVSKNRCLMNEVNYSLNYQLKTYEDRKDHDEEQKYGDSKNKLVMSQVVCYLGCQLKTEVPEFLCSAPNVIMVVASGMPFSGMIPEVNVPEGIEKFCSQQEDNKLDVRVSKNRCLMSEVNYSLNYQLKMFEDRKDHDEEQKYGDSENKLLMSQVVYYLAGQLTTEVPGFLCSAPNVIMVASGRPLSGKISEVNISEGIEKFCSQQEDNKPNVGVSKNRCLMSEVNYSLNYQLKTYNDQKDHDEEQKYGDSKNKLYMSQAAYYLGCRLNMEGKALFSGPGRNAMIVHSTRCGELKEDSAPYIIWNLQESVEEEAPQESWDEGDSTLSVPPGTSAFNETYRSNLHALEEQQVNLAVDTDKIKNDQEEEDQGPPCPRLSMELVEAEEPEVFRYSLDLLYSTHTAYPEFYYTCQAYTYVIFVFVEERVRLTLDMDSRFLTMTVIRLPLVSRAEKVPFVSHRDCNTRTVPPFVHHHDRGTRAVPPFVYHHDHGTRTVPPFVYHHDRDTRTVPPFVHHHDRDTRTVPPFVYHHDRDTRTVPPFVHHHDRDTRTVPPFVYHHDRGTRTVPPFVYHHDRDTRTVPPFVYHHDRDTRTVPPFVYHHDWDTRTVPPFVYHHDCDTRTVPPFVYHHDRGTRIVPPFVHRHDRDTGLFQHLSTTMILVPELFHHFSITMIVIQQLFHHLSTTMILVPGLFHHLSTTMTVHHDRDTRTVPPFVYHRDHGTRTVPPFFYHHDCDTRTVPPFVCHHDCGTRTVPPFICQDNHGTRTVPPFVCHHDHDTRTVPPFVYHHYHDDRSVPFRDTLFIRK